MPPDWIPSYHIILNFALGVLRKGETCKVEFEENVQDIIDKTLCNAITFKVQ